MWAPLYHEDSPERLPGPELADYLELPINDAARMRAESYDADRISVVQDHQCWPHAAEPFVTSTNFKKQADATGFNPTPCSAR